MTTTNLTAEMATVLGCKEKAIPARMNAIGLTNVCGRCGGSGHYSYCPSHGTTCFGCSGLGTVVMKITPALLDKARELVEAGTLVPYLKALEARSKAKKITGRAMTAWGSSKVGTVYNKRWHDDTLGQDVRTANTGMHDLYQRASAIATLIEFGRGKGQPKLTDAEVVELFAEADSIPAKITALDFDTDKPAPVSGFDTWGW